MEGADKMTATVKTIDTARKPVVIHRRIGSIVYEVEIHFNPNAKENFNDKILRLIRRDLEFAS